MTQQTQTECYLEQISHYQNSLNTSFENKEILEKALNHFSESGVPNSKNDSWKYSKVDQVLPKRMANDQSKFVFDTEIPPFCVSYVIAIIGNHISLEHSILPKDHNGKNLIEVNYHGLEVPFQYEEELYTDSLDSLCLSNYHGTISIKIGDNVSLDKALQLIYFPLKNNEEVLFTPHIQIQLGKNSKCHLIEYIPEGPASIFSHLTLFCDTNSHLNHIKIQLEQSINIGKTIIKQRKDCSLKSFIFSSGSKLSRNHYIASLEEEGAHAEVNGIYALSNQNQSDQFIEIKHKVQNTTSQQLFKGILSDHAHGIFKGNITISRNANQVNANQLNKNLLLSDTAKIETKPSLGVYADDVKCTHGATTGQLNEEQLFYLMSRGIKKQKALSLLISGFINDSLEQIDDQEIRMTLSEKINKQFDGKYE